MSFSTQNCNPLLSQYFFSPSLPFPPPPSFPPFFLPRLFFKPRLRIWLAFSLLASNFLKFKLLFLFITGRKRVIIIIILEITFSCYTKEGPIFGKVEG